jgi:hypothetical protein
MNTALVAWLALGISVISLVVSIFNSQRDRARLRLTSRYFQGWEGFTADIKIEMVNAGRRPIILSMLRKEATKRNRLGLRSNENWSGEYLDHPKGLTLEERESHSIELEFDDLFFQTGNDDVYFADDICVLDTLGNRHKIKGIRKNIAKLNAWKARQKSFSRPPNADLQ